MTTSISISPLAVRRAVWIDATPGRVWDEFTTFERMRAWFGTGHELVTYEPGLGGRVEIDPGGYRAGGAIVVFEPGSELTFEDDVDNQEWKGSTYITIRLTSYADGTVVELFHHGFERTGEPAGELFNGYEGGWTLLQLNTLRTNVEGR